MSKYLLSVLVCIFFVQVHSQSFTENFDDITTLTATGWFQKNNSAPLGTNPTWFQGNPLSDGGPFNAYNGAGNAYIACNFNSTSGTGTISNWLVTPNRTLRNGDVFTFYTRKPTVLEDYPDRLQVRMSTNGTGTNVGTAATDVGDFTTLLLEINPSLLRNVYPQVWTQYTVTISGLPAPTSGRLAFRYYVNNAGPNGANSDYIGIDNVVYTATDCPDVIANAVQVNTSCNGANDGIAAVSPSGGFGFNYIWSHDQNNNTNVANGLSAGTYSCTIINNCGNSIMQNFTITEPSLIIVNLVKDISCENPTENIFTANPSGGTLYGSDYMYQWSNGATTASVANLPLGNHWVKVTDGNNCEVTENFEITAEPIQIIHDDTISLCFNESVTLSPQVTPELEPGGTKNDFTGSFATENWQQTSFNSDGSFNFNGNTQLALVSGDNGSFNSGYNLTYITVQYDTEISFNWSYSTVDHPEYDYPQVKINNQSTNLQGYSVLGSMQQSGTHTILVPAGNTFGIEMVTVDNTSGAATLLVNNFSYTENSNGSYIYVWTDSEGHMIGNQPTYDVFETGTYTLTVTNPVGCSASKTIEVVWEVEPPQAEMIHFFSDGATLADIPVQGENLVWINPIDGETLPETTLIQDQTGYLVTQTIDGCTSIPAQIITIKDPVTWTGTEWINGTPSEDVFVRILGDLNVGTDTPDFSAFVLFISPEGSVTISDGHAITIANTYLNESNLGAGGFVIESGGNLLQLSEFPNDMMMGEMTIVRDSNPMKRLDYTLWSSPVLIQNLFDFSPETVNGVTNYQGSTGRIYIYDGANGYVNPSPFNADAVMKSGVGYLFRAPNNYHATNEVVYEGTFTGLPNNGTINVATHPLEYTSIGNPYPSNIGANNLLLENFGINAIYFWNNNDVSGGNYSTCTLNNCVAAAGGGAIPNGIITVGQGFIVETISNSVNFSNNMRVSNPGIFSKNDSETHRIWLNLNNQENEGLNQILVGYMEGATNNIDHQIDGKLFPSQTSALYNIIDEEKFVIQGRALPFEATDVVQLGFKAAQAGKFNISLDNFDGLFAEGNVKIYLNDKELSIKHNLMDSDYTFESAAGEFKSRFEVVYETEEVMGTDDLYANAVQIYTRNDLIIINSKSEKILAVEIYDLSGRKIHTNKELNADHYEIKTHSKEIFVVKVQIQNGEIITKKLIIK